MILQNTVASNIIPYHQNFVNKILTQSKSFGDFGEKDAKKPYIRKKRLRKCTAAFCYFAFKGSPRKPDSQSELVLIGN